MTFQSLISRLGSAVSNSINDDDDSDNDNESTSSSSSSSSKDETSTPTSTVSKVNAVKKSKSKRDDAGDENNDEDTTDHARVHDVDTGGEGTSDNNSDDSSQREPAKQGMDTTNEHDEDTISSSSSSSSNVNEKKKKKKKKSKYTMKAPSEDTQTDDNDKHKTKDNSEGKHKKSDKTDDKVKARGNKKRKDLKIAAKRVCDRPLMENMDRIRAYLQRTTSDKDEKNDIKDLPIGRISQRMYNRLKGMIGDSVVERLRDNSNGNTSNIKMAALARQELRMITIAVTNDFIYNASRQADKNDKRSLSDQHYDDVINSIKPRLY